MRRHLALLLTLGCGIAVVAAAAAPAQAIRPKGWPNACTWNAWQCTEVFDPIGPNGAYTGHDEPSLLFYSNRRDSGNSVLYKVVLPKEPPKLPTQDGSVTWNFELRPAFWFGMTLCDNQSAPEYTTTCVPDSDSNIKVGADPSQPNYIGYHSGSGYMEMQFYPPGWAQWPPGVSCSASQWCAALNIDSYSLNMNTNVPNNAACLNSAGVEPADFAFLTHNGTPTAPVDARTAFSPPYSQITPDPRRDLFMNGGDTLLLRMSDTYAGFKVSIYDLTTHQQGSMTAGASNGFTHVLYQPNSKTCNVEPYTFHPMYSTSSEQTQVPWAAHTYNVAVSDEIGHFELCSDVDESSGLCNDPDEPVTDPGFDDYACFGPGDFGDITGIGGCLGQDTPDFDGVPYQASSWPGNGNDANTPAPFTMSSPLIDGFANYSRVAFEADLPRIEAPDLGGTCDRSTGAGCTNPPVPGAFYPIYTTGTRPGIGCVWQIGGPNYPGTTNNFGGNSVTEYGPLLQSLYPGPGYMPIYRFNNFRRVLPNNPCPSGFGF
jgi:hypothetical protein